MKPQNSDPSLRISSKALEAIAVTLPPIDQQKQRLARFSKPGEKRGRYHLPESLDSGSPVGFRRRVSMSQAEVQECLPLFSMDRPVEFVPGAEVSEGELFEECSLGVLTARQSTNYRGHRDVVLGSADSARMAALLRQLKGLEASPLDGASHTHVVFCRPYRTPFTLLLTFIGHGSLTSPWTVATRAWRKKFQHVDDIPSIRWLMHVHLGILADAMERATVIASGGHRRAQTFMSSMCGDLRHENRTVIRDIELLAGLTTGERAAGWRLALVTQVGTVAEHEKIKAQPETLRKLGANLIAFRSERIQPGVNHEEKAPEAYQNRQTMDIPEELTVQAGRAAYNAFAHFSGCERERAKSILLLDRIDVLTPHGKDRIREVREMLDHVTDRVVDGIPLWADLATGKNLSSNAARGKKAFGLAGQRIYIGGLSGKAMRETGMDMELATRAFGAAAARSGLVAELMGVMDLPETCDLLAGLCLMAGPVNQNDIGKAFYGQLDLLHTAYPDEEPTSLLVWTLKAKTVADPIGNEEQLMNAARKGALVDLRAAPHDVVSFRIGDALQPMRRLGVRVNQERAFEDVGNFVTDPDGFEIPGNRGTRWPDSLRNANPFSTQLTK